MAAEDIRNVAVVGHTGSGKTMLCEAMLKSMGAIKDLGAVDKGTTVCDHDALEKERGSSIFAAVAHGTWKKKDIALIDAPRELKVRYGERRVRVEYRVNGKLEDRDFPLEGLAENAAFLTALREPSLQTVHTQETSLENIFIRVTGQELA